MADLGEFRGRVATRRRVDAPPEGEHAFRMTIYLAPLICALGLVLFLLADSRPDAKKIGFAMFAIGLFWTVGNAAAFLSVHAGRL